MEKNVGSADRTIRIILALVIIGMYAAGTISGTLATILIIFAAVLVITSIVSFCPLYTIFKIRSNKKA